MTQTSVQTQPSDDELMAFLRQHGDLDTANGIAAVRAAIASLSAPVAAQAHHVDAIDTSRGCVEDFDKNGHVASQEKPFGYVYKTGDNTYLFFPDRPHAISNRWVETEVFSLPQEQQPLSGADGLPIELRGVSEAATEGDGFWRSCSGCHELNEGHDTGPQSKVFKCALGNGCSECGGIGAVWDTTDYGAMGDA